MCLILLYVFFTIKSVNKYRHKQLELIMWLITKYILHDMSYNNSDLFY